ncbi:hypothetical protein GCM10027280_56800 [Micromonospora polyrhachis]
MAVEVSLVTVNLASYPVLQLVVRLKDAVAADAAGATSTVAAAVAATRAAAKTAVRRERILIGSPKAKKEVRSQGRVARCGFTVRAKLLPLATSQLIDQVIAPRMPG